MYTQHYAVQDRLSTLGEVSCCIDDYGDFDFILTARLKDPAVSIRIRVTLVEQTAAVASIDYFACAWLRNTRPIFRPYFYATKPKIHLAARISLIALKYLHLFVRSERFFTNNSRSVHDTCTHK